MRPRNTAQVETCLTGYSVDVVPYMPFDGATTWGRPSVPGLVEALETAWRSEPVSKEVVRERVMSYDADRVFAEHFLPALELALG